MNSDVNLHGHKETLAWLKRFMRKAKSFQFRSVEFKKEMVGGGWRLIVFLKENKNEGKRAEPGYTPGFWN